MEQVNKEIKNLSNEEIKERVLDLNKLQLKFIKESSLLNILLSLNAVKTLRDKNKIYDEKYDLEAKRLLEIVSELEELLINQDEKRLLEIREELVLYKNIVEGYLVETEYLGELIDELGLKILAKKESLAYNPKAVENLIGTIKMELEKSQDNYPRYAFIISEVVRTLPMRMVKSKYRTIVSSTLLRNMQSFNEAMVDYSFDNYKKRFDSSLRDGYGTKFDYYFFQIERMKRENIGEMDLDGLSQLVEATVGLTEELNSINDFILSLGIVSNLIYVNYRTQEVDIDSDRIIADWQESYASEDAREAYSRKLSKKLAGLEKDLEENLVEYEAYALSLARKEDFKDEELDRELLATRGVLAYYNDLKFSGREYLESIDLSLATREYIENSIEDLLEYMARSSADMKNMERKIRMRKILSLIDLPFGNINEFGDYIRYSLDSRIVDKDEINFKLNQIYYFLNEIKEK